MSKTAKIKKYAVVLRFEGMYPHQLGGFEGHRTRKGGDLNHVDRAKSHLNERLIGDEDWAEKALLEIQDMAADNFASELEALEARKRRKDIKTRMVEGPKNPWRPTRHGPMREVILTANSEWFDEEISGFFDEAENTNDEEKRVREVEFRDCAVAWLKHHFGDDVIHARADRDEKAYHIHAVILPRTIVEIAKPKAKTKVKTATRRMLQPSIHPMIEDYEAAQDDVGVWFDKVGLTRGERRAEAIRQARANGEEQPKPRYHARTSQWRAEQEQLLEARGAALDARATAVEAREDEAEAVLAVAEGIETGAVEIDASGDVPVLKKSDAGKSDAATQIEARMKRSPSGVARAVGIFGAAWRRLSGRAREDAEQQANAGVAGAIKEIRAADDAIVEIARALPLHARETIGKQRKGLFARLRILDRWTGGGTVEDRGKTAPSMDDE